MTVAHSLGYDRFNSTLKLTSLSSLERAIKEIEGLTAQELNERLRTRAFTALQEVEDHINDEIADFIAEQVSQGATTITGSREVFERFQRIGLESHQAETLFRTQSQLAFNAGKWLAEQQPEIQEILWGYRYSTVGDDRVRDEHAQFEGVTLPKEHPFWQQFYPPNGFNCRCILIPILTQTTERPPPGDALPISEDFQFNPGELFHRS